MHPTSPEDISEKPFFESVFPYVQRQLRRAVKRSLLRYEQYQVKLLECQNWHLVHHQAQLLQSNLFRLHKGMTHLLVLDWEQDNKEVRIDTDPLIEPSEFVKQMFRKSRKLRIGQSHLLKQVNLAKELLVKYEKQMADLSAISSLEQLKHFCLLNQWQMEKSPIVPHAKLFVPRLPYEEYISKQGLQIWVGKSAKDNDRLTFQCANGSDYWLHVRDYPGSHVVIRCMKNKKPDQESLSDAIELALRFSKCKGEGEVCITQIKYLKRVKGIAGKVMFSKHQTVFAVPDINRWNQLRSLA
jgi:predicted ribosome quality control (RQC) complex YloA/Tae2 family protein